MTAALAIYFHIPFCTERCPYCDFYTLDRARTAPDWRDRLPGALRRELALHCERWRLGRHCRVRSVFFGGGTPSLLQGGEIEDIVGAVGDRLALDPDAEITLEANPENVTAERAARWRSAGVNRVSLGVQSLQAAELRALGRVHSPEQIAAATAALRESGFSNLNLDLIFGIPGQTAASLLKTLERALTLEPQHLSLYNLTVHAGTPLARMIARGEVSLPPEEEQCSMFIAARRFLTARGWEHYEISNYALPGSRCRHNMAYWTGAPYLGIGPSAHSFLWDETEKAQSTAPAARTGALGVRFSAQANLAAWLAAIDAGRLPIMVDDASRQPTARANELLLSGLRLLEGLDPAAFQAQTGIDLERERAGQISAMRRDGLIAPPGPRLRLTEKGLLLSDHIIRELAF
ncbi:MAG: radical SAM family heme chaperone HemW [Candidatus Sumerlaeia bacterium]